MRLHQRFPRTTFATLGSLTLLICGFARAQIPTKASDTFTPVVASIMGPQPAAVHGTDGLYHLIYELKLSNTKPANATLRRIDIIDSDHPDTVIASYAGKRLLDSLRTLQPRPADSAVIPVNASRLLYIELAFKPGQVPRAITHRMNLLGAGNPAPTAPATPLDYRAASFELGRTQLPIVGPPLRGKGWLAINGCCNNRVIHRGSFLGVNGGLYNAQRFAIDYMRLNSDGEAVHGDPEKSESYPGYGADILAVADGTVVATLDHMDDQKPGSLPDAADISMETVDGNHVVIDIGRGQFAFYAHLQKGSVSVREGDLVKRGMVIGKLGNSGNTSAPHLHFHIMNGTSVLGSSGLPYLIDHFSLSGLVDASQFDQAPSLEGQWSQRNDKPAFQNNRFPMNLNLVDFPRQGAPIESGRVRQ